MHPFIVYTFGELLPPRFHMFHIGTMLHTCSCLSSRGLRTLFFSVRWLHTGLCCMFPLCLASLTLGTLILHWTGKLCFDNPATYMIFLAFRKGPLLNKVAYFYPSLFFVFQMCQIK